jgi:hypothetical protein
VAIKISLVADVADAVSGAEKVADSYEGVQDALDDVAREARKTEDALGDVGDGTKDAERASDDMERKFRGDFDKIRADAKRAGDTVGKEFKEGTDRAEEGMDEFKDEAGGTAREAAASFDGSADSIAEVFQELSANAFAGFGPAGAVAGVAAAVGLGIAISTLTKVAEKTNEAKERGAEWAQSFNSATVEDRLAALRDRWAELGSTITDSREWYEIGQTAAVTALDSIAAAARSGQPGVEDFIEAFNTTVPEERLRGLREALAELETAGGSAGEHARAVLGGDEAEQAYLDRIEGVKELESVIRDEISAQEAANEIDRARADTMGVSIDQYRDYNELSDEAKDRIDNVAEGQKGLAVETEKANSQIEEQNELTRELIGSELDWLDTLDGLSEQVDKNGTSLSRNTSKGRENIRYILDAADSIDELYEATLSETGSQERAERARSKATRELIEQAEAAGYDERQIGDLIERINRMPGSKTTDIRADTRDARRSIRDFVNSRPSDVWTGVRVDTSRASEDVASFRHTQSSIPIPLQLRAV